MAIYTTKNSIWQMTVDNRLQGWQVCVSYWTGEEFVTQYDRYVIADNLFEATFGALADSSYPEDRIESRLAEWGIFMPEEDED